MNKIIKLILLSLFSVSCSLNSDSSFWTKRNISEEQKIVNIKQITKKDEILMPSNGEKVTRKEYDEIVKFKMEEMKSICLLYTSPSPRD